MRRILTIMCLLLAVAVLAGCGTHLRNPADDTRSLAYGFVDMEDAPTKLAWATIKQMKPVKDKPYWGAGADGSGLFWNEHLEPGSYMLTSFGGHSVLRNASYTYEMPEYGSNGTAKVIKKPGMYYMGAYKYTKEGSFFNPKFSIEPVESPTEREVLEMLLPLSTGTQWEAMIKARIAKLGRS
jgi:hypothetical protein